jgi:hypothetical protein
MDWALFIFIFKQFENFTLFGTIHQMDSFSCVYVKNNLRPLVTRLKKESLRQFDAQLSFSFFCCYGKRLTVSSLPAMVVPGSH